MSKVGATLVILVSVAAVGGAVWFFTRKRQAPPVTAHDRGGGCSDIVKATGGLGSSSGYPPAMAAGAFTSAASSQICRMGEGLGKVGGFVGKKTLSVGNDILKYPPKTGLGKVADLAVAPVTAPTKAVVQGAKKVGKAIGGFLGL